MNTASQNLPHHLGVLREHLQHATDYEKALYYFLEEFAGDVPFMEQSLTADAPHLLAVLTHVASKAMNRTVQFDETRVLHLTSHKFYHGNGALEQRVALFFYFEELDAGLMALIPGVNGPVEVARFRLKGGLGGNPSHN